MARLHSIKIENFRGIEFLSHTFGKENLYCLIGRGDSGKSTILDAIYYVLSPVWNEAFNDGDFFNCDLTKTIRIEATLLEIPTEFTHDRRFYDYLKSYDPRTHEVSEELDETIPDGETRDHAITIQLEVTKELEPEWRVICDRHEEAKPISHTDRKKLNVFVVSESVDRHFQWTKWNPLYYLHSQSSPDESTDQNVVLDILRAAKQQLDKIPFEQFATTMKRVVELGKKFGMDMPNTKTTIDFRDIVVKDGRFSLHDEILPFRVKGKGTKRLISMAMQTALCKNGGIMLIDEVEQSLESFRVKHAVATLKKEPGAQVFLTTHSTDVLEELGAGSILLMRKRSEALGTFSDLFNGLIRSNPQGFFHERILVCEGKTEIGLCRAIDRWLIEQRGISLALKAIGIVSGGGSELVNRCRLLANGGFQVILFCDSDEKVTNDHKLELKELGVEIVDFSPGEAIEDAMFASLPTSGVKKLLMIARDYRMEDKGLDLAAARNSIWDSVTTKFVGDCPDRFDANTDSAELRTAIANAAKSKSSPWFKKINRGESIGSVCLEYKNQIAGTSFDLALNNLIEWIER